MFVGLFCFDSFQQSSSTVSLSTNNGVACGPGYPLILQQALGTRPVLAFIPNAE